MNMYPEMPNEKISIWKRIFIFLIDFITALILCIALLYSIGNPIVSSIAKNDINKMNVAIEGVCEKYSYPTEYDSIYGLLQLNQEEIIDNKIKENMTHEQAFESYMEIYNKLYEELNANEMYASAYKNFYIKYTFTEIGCAFSSLLIFQLIIPLANKKKQSLGMMMFQASCVDKDNIALSNIKITLRFFMIFLVEFLTVYLILSILGEIFLVLISLVMISLTKNRSTVHDLILKSKIAPLTNVYTE